MAMRNSWQDYKAGGGGRFDRGPVPAPSASSGQALRNVRDGRGTDFSKLRQRVKGRPPVPQLSPVAEIVYRNAGGGVFMRTIILFLLLGSCGVAQDPSASRSNRGTCACLSARVLSRPVVRAMWSQDEDEHPYAERSGSIRIAVRPTWSAEFFVDVRVNRKGAAAVVLYSLPKGTKTLDVLLEKELKQNPCADVKSLAKRLPVQRRFVEADKKMQDLITDFYALRWEPRRIPDSVRLDATEYELEYIGDDTLLFQSDDEETPVVKWAESFLSAVLDAAHR